MINKLGKSSDPVQQALRDHKKRWNVAVKEFKRRLSSLSKGLNGRGDPSYGIPPTDIKEPLPSEINNFLNELAGNFQQLAEEAVKIQQEQDYYSQNRKKPVEAPPEASPKIATASAKAYLEISNRVIPTLLAITSEEQEKGLMYANWPPPIMSFVYNKPQINRFWMKNTPSPLDIVFSHNGIITDIKKGEPNSTSIIGGYLESDLVIEMPFGTCKDFGIKIGDKVILKKS